MPSKRPTINDVAARAGVSKSLVSLALRGSDRVSPESREAILDAAASLGYRANAAARNLADRRSRTVGVLVLDLHNPIYAQVVDGVCEEVSERGYHAMIVTGRDDEAVERFEIDKLLEFQVEGLVLIGHRLPGGSMESVTAECPAVMVSRRVDTVPGLDSVSNDDVGGAALAVDHLVALGHTHIAHITGGANDVAHLRRAGYEQAMAAHGLTDHAVCVEGSFGDDGGYRGAVAVMREHPDTTALFVANDLAAVGALAALQDEGLQVPDEVSVVGYDGMGLGALRSLGLTTVAQPLLEMGRSATRLLFDRIGNATRLATHLQVTPELVVRRTTAPPRRSAAANPRR